MATEEPDNPETGELLTDEEDCEILSGEEWAGAIPGLSSDDDEGSSESSDGDTLTEGGEYSRQNDSDVDIKTAKIPDNGRRKRCWRHFERHFDYMVDRVLRPVEEYVVGRSQLMNDPIWEDYYLSHSYVTAPGGVYTGSIGCSLRSSLAALVHAYKLSWRTILGTYECPIEDKTTTMHYYVEREYQRLLEPSEPAESPWLGSLSDDGWFNSTSRVSGASDLGNPSAQSAGEATPNLFSSSEAEDLEPQPKKKQTPELEIELEPLPQRATQQVNVTPVSTLWFPPNVMPSNTHSKCPGFDHSSIEMIMYLEKNGCDQFYAFVDQLFTGLDGCKAGSRYIYAIDILKAIIRLMPELLTLLIRPKFSNCIDGGRNWSYFKRLIIMVRSFLKFMGTESPLLASDMYRDAAGGCYTPFFLITGSKEVRDRQACSAMTAAILLRIFKFAALVSSKCMDWVFLREMNVGYRRSLTQRLKRFVYMPLFSMRQVHELMLPVTGTFNINRTCLFDFDYLQWIRSYLYPPPPLYMLRIYLVKIVRMCVLTTSTNVNGCYNVINDALMKDHGRSLGIHYEDLLRRQIFMLCTGASFFLASDFLRTCAVTPEVFFGSYFTLLPHVHYSFQTTEVDLLIEQETYKLQECVIDLLKVTVDGDFLSRDNILGLPGITEMHSTVIKRLLGLAWHYVTAPNMDDKHQVVKMQPIVEPWPKKGQCRGLCRALAPYSTTCSVEFLDQIKPYPVKFKHHYPRLKRVKCVYATSDELGDMAYNQEYALNHSRSDKKSHVTVMVGASRTNPMEIICEPVAKNYPEDGMPMDPELNAIDQVTVGPQHLKPCNLRCLLLRHMNRERADNIVAHRWSVIMQSMNVLFRYLGERAEHQTPPFTRGDEAWLGSIAPMWYALIDMVCTAHIRGELPSHIAPDFYPSRESFMGKPVT